jgi:hypothetical protein
VAGLSIKFAADQGDRFKPGGTLTSLEDTEFKQ